MISNQPSRSPKSARIFVSLFFAFNGATITIWAVHIPKLMTSLQLNTAQIGIALFVYGFGAFLAMQFAGRSLDRWGSQRVLPIYAALSGLGVALVGFSSNYWQFIASLLFLGLFLASTDVSMNTQAVEIEGAYKRPIFSSFHAMWSIGGMAGSALGALAMGVQLPIWITLSFWGIASIVFSAVGPKFLLVKVVAQAPKEKLSKAAKQAEALVAKQANRPYLGLILGLGAMAGSGALIEGTGIDWSSLYQVRVFGDSVGHAALAVTLFSGAMAAFRFIADRVIGKIGRVRLVRYGALVAAVGGGTAMMAPNSTVALFGWAISGLGISSVVPQIFAYSANVGPESHAGRNMAKVFGLTYVGMLGGPTVIGGLAGVIGIHAALWCGAILALAMFFASFALKEKAQISF